jgi:hypothetical protein
MISEEKLKRNVGKDTVISPITVGNPVYIHFLPFFFQANFCADIVTSSWIVPTIFFIWFMKLLALRPLLAYCASLG